MRIVLYLACIVAANVLAANYTITLAERVAVPAGTLAIAPIFTLRDSVHHRYGSRIVVYLVLVASLLSYMLSLVLGHDALGRVTIASVIAFVSSELLDTAIYRLLHSRVWLTRVLTSNTVACAADTAIFLMIAFSFDWSTFAAQYLIKIGISSLLALLLLRMHDDRPMRIAAQ